MRLRGRHHPLSLGLQPDATEQVMRHQRHQQRQHHGRQQETQQEPLERVCESVVTDVTVKLRVTLPEGFAVQPQQPRPPATGRRDTRYDTEQGRDPEQDQNCVRFNGDSVALEVLLLKRQRADGWSQPVRKHKVGTDRHRHQGTEYDEQQYPR